MFICSVKLNKTRVLSVIAALCLSFTLIFLMLPDAANTTTSGQNELKDEKGMVEYLSNIGHTVAPNALLVEEVTIPAEFDDTYANYNELQKLSGFDLTKYAGKTAMKYTFKVLNDAENAEEKVINLLVFENHVIGGDVSTTQIGGEIKGLIESKETEQE